MSWWPLNCGPGTQQIHLKCHLYFFLKLFVHNTPTGQVEQVKIPVHWSDSHSFQGWRRSQRRSWNIACYISMSKDIMSKACYFWYFVLCILWLLCVVFLSLFLSLEISKYNGRPGLEETIGCGKDLVFPPSNHIQERESQVEGFCWTVWYLSNQRRDLLV